MSSSPMSDEPQVQDKVYTDEGSKLIGKHFALVYKGMLEGGMGYQTAQFAIAAYIGTFTRRPDVPKEDKDA